MPCCLSCRENVKIRAIIAALTVAEGSCETGENIGDADKKLDQLTEVSGGSPSENWRDVDKFIKNGFNPGVFLTYQTRFLTYLRNHLRISNEHD